MRTYVYFLSAFFLILACNSESQLHFIKVNGEWKYDLMAMDPISNLEDIINNVGEGID